VAADYPAGGFNPPIHLSEELRRQLGIQEDESIRLIHSGGRILVLERAGGDPSSAVPWDRDLVLSADVRAFPLADVLAMLHDAGKSGFLCFGEGELQKSVYLHRGEVVFATSNQTVDRLGECLLRAGIVELEQLCEAERCWTPPTRFGKVLVERGFLTPRELWNGVKHQVEEIVRSLFSHTAGCLHFWEGLVQPDNVVRLSLPTRRLIAEGLELRDRLLRFVATLEDPRTRLVKVEGYQVRECAGNEREVLESVASEPGFAGICRRAGLDPLSCARTIQLLCLMDALKVERAEADASADSRTQDEQAVRTCVRNHVKLLTELTAPLVAVEGIDQVEQRLSAVIEEIAGRFPELLGDLRVGKGGLLDPDEIASRALRLVGDRERAVSSALGELVAYVEFELKNSPHIEEPDRFLDAVEDLRAQLSI
jgi:hypothetical protein